MLTNLRRRKITLLFLVLDQDENGYIERQDFERVAHDLAELREHLRFSDAYRQLNDSFSAIFDNIQQFVDDNNNLRIELEEWVAYFSHVLDDDEKYADLIAPMANNIFSLLDHNDDKKIALEEYRHFASVYNIDDSNIDNLFAQLDTNHNGFITRDEFGYLITDFFLSDDEDRPGNYLFGKF